MLSGHRLKEWGGGCWWAWRAPCFALRSEVLPAACVLTALHIPWPHAQVTMLDNLDRVKEALHRYTTKVGRRGGRMGSKACWTAVLAA